MYPIIDFSVVTSNSSNLLSGFFESICDQNYPLNKLRLLFHDLGSTDETVMTLERFREEHGDHFCQVLIYSSGYANAGRAHKSNLSHANGPFFLVGEIGVSFEPDTLTNLVETALLDDAQVAAWECRQKPFENPKHYHPATLETDWVSGCCTLFRFSSLVEVGGFETQLDTGGYEQEVSFRLRSRGYVLRYVPASVVWDVIPECERESIAKDFSRKILGNALLRLRYGSFRHIFYLPLLFFLHFLAPSNFHRQRRAIVSSFCNILLKGPYFLITRKRGNIALSFNHWDYGVVRKGSKYRFSKTKPDGILPLVSVMIRTMAGREGKLREAVLSVLNQTYPRIELVVVEDGSRIFKDFIESETLKEKLEGVTYRSLPRVGRCRAGNEALASASGDLLCFLDDDDLFYADHLEVLVAAIIEQPRLGAVYGLSFETKVQVVSHEPWVYRELSYDLIHRQVFSRAILWHHNFMAIQAVLFRREIYDQLGGFDEELENLEDWNLWVRFSQVHDFSMIDKVTSIYRVAVHPRQALNRQKLLDDYYCKARSKHDAMRINVSLAEVAVLAEELMKCENVFVVSRSTLRRLALGTPLVNYFYHQLRKIGAFLRD